jgi:hypothetical protein
VVELRELLLSGRITTLIANLESRLSDLREIDRSPVDGPSDLRLFKVAHRLTDDTRAEIAASYEAGTPSTSLTSQFNLGKARCSGCFASRKPRCGGNP